MKILLTGATGFVGRAVCKALALEGHELVVVTRDPIRARSIIPAPHLPLEWDFSKEVPPHEWVKLKNIDAVIHLAGEPILGKRWSPEFKANLEQSRIGNTQRLVSLLKDSANLPKIFISASAIGIYGDRADEILDESASVGGDFLAQLCQGWEGAVFNSELSDSRKVALRIGIVLGKGGGALDQMLPLFTQGLGGLLGSGRQWMSWIHLDDLVSIILKCLHDKTLSGPINCSSPYPVTNREFTQHLVKSLNTVQWIKIPKFALQLGLGEVSSALLSSQRVTPRKLDSISHQFRYPKLGTALNEILGSTYSLAYSEFSTQCWIPRPIEEVFHFFSDAANLEKITPTWLKFHILFQSSKEMQAGISIEYSLKLHGLPIRWRTEISSWNPPDAFTDVQMKGPYKDWKHTHRFIELQGGTLMEDQVLYRLPFGFVGNLFASNYVKKDVSKIFSYRNHKIYELLMDQPTSERKTI